MFPFGRGMQVYFEWVGVSLVAFSQLLYQEKKIFAMIVKRLHLVPGKCSAVKHIFLW